MEEGKDGYSVVLVLGRPKASLKAGQGVRPAPGPLAVIQIEILLGKEG